MLQKDLVHDSSLRYNDLLMLNTTSTITPSTSLRRMRQKMIHEKGCSIVSVKSVAMLEVKRQSFKNSHINNYGGEKLYLELLILIFLRMSQILINFYHLTNLEPW